MIDLGNFLDNDFWTKNVFIVSDVSLSCKMATLGEEQVSRGGEGREDAYVESVDDGINTGNDDYTYTYWDVFKYR